MRWSTGSSTRPRAAAKRRRLPASSWLRLAQRAAGVAAWELDLGRREFACGEEFLWIHGISTPTTEKWLAAVELSDRAQVEQSLDRSVESGEPFDCEYRVIREGQTRWIQSRAGPSPEGPGRVVRLAGWSADITERKLAESELRTSNNALRALWANLQSAREEERARIAREIHDDLGQSLTVLKINLARLEGSLIKAGQAAPATLTSAIRQVDSALQAVRRIIAELHPVILDELGLGPALEWAVAEFSKQSGVPCQLEFDLRGVRLSKEQSAAFFRIVQESLANIGRHAHATRAWVGIRSEAGLVELKVTDNGLGLDRNELQKRDSFGIAGMRERAVLMGASLVLDGQPGQGTTVRLSLRT
jgi:two-component system, NarL family, sensor histidine kinase UhpB